MSSTTNASNTQTGGVTTDPASQDATDYGVYIDGNGYFRGYAWADSGGWVSFYDGISTTAYTQTASDYSLPASTITYPQDQSTLKNVNQIIGRSTDADSDVNYTRISIYDRNLGLYYTGTGFSVGTEQWLTTTGATVASTTEWYYLAPTWQEGHNYTIRSRATDVAGNEEHTDSITFTYNTTSGQAGSIYVSNPSYQTNANYKIYYPNTSAVATNGYLVVDFPEEYRLNPWISGSDVILSNQSSSITSSSDVFNRATKTITSTITGGSVGANDLIEMDINNLRIHNPTATGSYTINMYLYDNTDALLESGSGVLVLNRPYQQIEMTAEVQQSLQLSTNSGSINIQVDPDVQQGQNWVGTGGIVSDYSNLIVQTNANNGYNLQVKLSGFTATGTAVLDGSGTPANQITSTSGARLTNENNFSFALGNSGSTTTSQFTNVSVQISGAGLAGPTNQNIDSIYYYLNVDHTLPNDIYKGSVTYTAIGNF